MKEEASHLHNSDVAVEAIGKNVHSFNSIALFSSAIIVLKPHPGVL